MIASTQQREFPFIDQVIQKPYWWVNDKISHAPIPQKPPDHREPIRFVLISCSKSKLTKAAPAKDLYIGQLFKRAVSWANRHELPWFVVSALHGLLLPNQEIPPYNFTIRDLRRREREQWANQVVSDLTRYATANSHAILILPEPYRRFIEPQLCRNKITYENPLAGMGIGQQLKWLAEH